MDISIKAYVSTDGMMENTFVVRDEGSGDSVVIDPGFYSDDIRDAVVESGSLKYIVLTHAHGDHISALPEYRKNFPEAELLAHIDEKEMLNSGSLNCSEAMYGRSITDEADIYVSDMETLPLGNSLMKFIHTPGHTRGGMCILIGDNVFSGDTLFMHSVGRTDLYGGNMDSLVNSIKNKLYTLPEYTLVYCGHGPGTSIGEEKRSNPFV